jgi:CRP/FNR family transcriptional regulator, cyclic AMP receptor protein
MSMIEAFFQVIEEENCPIYEENEEFKLFANALHLPNGKPICTMLMDDIKTRIDEGEEVLPEGNQPGSFFCSGCTGKIRLQYEKGTEYIFEIEDPHENAKENIAKLLSTFSFFKTLKKHEVRYLVPFIRHKQYGKGEIIIQKGQPGKNLYVILSGMVEVLGNNDINIAFLGKGDAAGATIKAVEPTKVIYLNSRNFRRLLRKFPTLQMYFATLLSKRLTKTNTARSDELESGMSGNLTEMPPSELLQTLNMNRKTGVLTFKLDGNRSAAITFKEGDLIRAKFGNLVDKEAFWDVLKERKGRFKFTPGLLPEEESKSEIGQFMWLLMEGLSRMDEEVFQQTEKRRINE